MQGASIVHIGVDGAYSEQAPDDEHKHIKTNPGSIKIALDVFRFKLKASAGTMPYSAVCYY